MTIISCLQERLKAIQVLIHDIDNERRRNETNLNNLYRLQEKYGSDEKSNSAQHKLRSQYKICMNDAVQEENVLRQALANILEIRNIRNERRIQVNFDVHFILHFVPFRFNSFVFFRRLEMLATKRPFDVVHS